MMNQLLKMRYSAVVIALFSLLWISSCYQDAGSNNEFSGDGVMLTALGPLFEGENTAQGEIDISHVLPGGDVFFTEAVLTDFQLSLANGGNFDQIEQMTLLLVNESSDMQKVAVINPVPVGVNELSFQLAALQKGTAALLNDDAITFVLDFTLKEDVEEDLVFLAKYKFEGTYKSK